MFQVTGQKPELCDGLCKRCLVQLKLEGTSTTDDAVEDIEEEISKEISEEIPLALPSPSSCNEVRLERKAKEKALAKIHDFVEQDDELLDEAGSCLSQEWRCSQEDTNLHRINELLARLARITGENPLKIDGQSSEVLENLSDRRMLYYEKALNAVTGQVAKLLVPRSGEELVQQTFRPTEVGQIDEGDAIDSELRLLIDVHARASGVQERFFLTCVIAGAKDSDGSNLYSNTQISHYLNISMRQVSVCSHSFF